MLTRGSSTTKGGGRRPGLVAAVVPTGRVAHPGLVALTVALAAVPTLVTLAVDGESYGVQIILLGLVTGASIGWAVDDPAAELLASAPVAAPVRTGLRAGASTLVAGAVLALVLVALAVGPGLPSDLGDRLPEGVVASCAALALGLLAARRGERAAGAAAVIAGVLTPAFVAALSFKLHQLPGFMGGTNHARWWLVAMAALAVALHAGRDPARR